jgi:acyl dehydratase
MTSLASRGDWIGGPPVVVSRDRAASFAAAVGETREDVLDGSILAPTFAITLAWDVQNRVLKDVLPDGLGLHGEQAFRFHAPIAPGMEVSSRAKLESVVPRRSGSTVTVRTESYDGSVLVCSQLFTVFVVGQTLPAWGSPTGLVPDVSPNDAGELRRLGGRIEILPPDQPSRYAAASGDTYQIHVDAAYARAMGLPGPIAHGMATLAYAARAVQEAIGSEARLTYLASRFSAAVTPGASLTTEVHAASRGDGQMDGIFGTTADAVTPVITDGRFVAQVRGPDETRTDRALHDNSSEMTHQMRTS